MVVEIRGRTLLGYHALLHFDLDSEFILGISIIEK